MILGKMVKINYSVDMDKDDCGEFDDSTMTISINLNRHDNEDLLKSTLLHEIIHAILFITGQNELLDSKQEEGLVRAIEHGLADIVTIY